MATPEPDKHGLITTGSSGIIRRMDQRLDLVSRLIQEIQDKESSRKNASLAKRSDAEEISVNSMVKVACGHLPALSEFSSLRAYTYYIARTTVTWAVWQGVRDWAVENGYDLGKAGAGEGSNYPVTNVNWYDALKWCNARSEMEKLTPVYRVRGEVYRSDELTPDVKPLADGYRLPFAELWELAARGGVESKGYEYSGSNDIDAVAWYRENSGPSIHEVATKQANELGIFDMSGNVWEWCYDICDNDKNALRALRGGSWFNDTTSCLAAGRYGFNPTVTSNRIGFRVSYCLLP